MVDNRRRFQRIPFDAEIYLTAADVCAEPIAGVLHDISLKGLLIAVPETAPAIPPQTCAELLVLPDQGDIELKFKVAVAYAREDRCLYGLNLLSLDVESATHLRRLIEVNLGDEQSLQRELVNLIEAMEAENIAG